MIIETAPKKAALGLSIFSQGNRVKIIPAYVSKKMKSANDAKEFLPFFQFIFTNLHYNYN